MDDGSTGSFGSICEEYVKYDKRIKLIHKKRGAYTYNENSIAILHSEKNHKFVITYNMSH